MNVIHEWRFRFIVLGQLLVFAVVAFTCGHFLITDGYHATSMVLGIMLLVQLVVLLNFIERQHHSLRQFIRAIEQGDFTQKFSSGGYYQELGTTFNSIMDRFKAQRIEVEEKNTYLTALVRQLPIAALSFDNKNRIILFNNAAKRLFSLNTPTTIEDLCCFSESFVAQLKKLRPGARSLVKIVRDGIEDSFMITATQFRTERKFETLITIENIRQELNDTEQKAWSDLISVLTHEIMNSITPIVSLANTSKDILSQQDLSALPPLELSNELGDIEQAVTTISGRGKSLMEFINGYRQVARIPLPELTTINIAELLKEQHLLHHKAIASQHIDLNIEIQPPSLELSADKKQVDQALINLLRNAIEACGDCAQPKISLSAYLRGSHTVIAVRDNGHGIKEEVMESIFVPFFTTKREGSGIGMGLIKQIMNGHGGEISVQSKENQGTTVELIF